MIVGFGLQETQDKIIYEYADIKAEPHSVKAGNINPYLVDAKDTVLSRRNIPLAVLTPEMNYGSMPIDSGWLILTDEVKNEVLKNEPQIAKYVKPYFGGEEFLNNIKRWCLWLVDANPSDMRNSKFISERISQNKKYRLTSNRPQTLEMANTPSLFGEIRQPKTQYLLLPKVSSENRTYMPIGFMPVEAIASGSALIIANANILHFGILQSSFHMAWLRTACGRMKSDYQYSAGIVYNNFPWPEPTDKQRANIEAAAQAVLNARTVFANASLADLYDPLTTPAILLLSLIHI